MRFVSTRGQCPPVTADKALRAGLAPDGGLYVPEQLPLIDEAKTFGPSGLGEIGSLLLAPYFKDSMLENVIEQICADAFNFPTPLISLPSGPQVLELFHGPTGAFKDFGARFLFRAFDHIADQRDPITVLAATSGDTGGAVGCAAEGALNAKAVILFPKDRISAFQERQLCCWHEPVTALRVKGDFDACQALVKQAFSNSELSRQFGLTSANSISIGRLLPQMSYWATAAIDAKAQTGKAPGLIIPTGNLGNAVAAIMARKMGLPIGPVVLATNANPTLSEWKDRGAYQARPAIATLANAMDVGAPSNFERLAHIDPSGIDAVIRVEDDAIQARIRQTHSDDAYIACPHTATGLEAYARLPSAHRQQRSWIIGATAHPYKFADIVEPLIGETIKPTPALANVLERETRVTDIEATLEDLTSYLMATGAAGRVSV
ncbi:MAG: threonine synthase [Alphaproteobacteria bacterium]|nr:threonine synthase [Alphaproteobacteria bacterium]